MELALALPAVRSGGAARREGARGADLNELFGEAVAVVAELISADFTEILELSQERDELVTRAGFGWSDDVDGQSGRHVGGRHPRRYSRCALPAR